MNKRQLKKARKKQAFLDAMAVTTLHPRLGEMVEALKKAQSIYGQLYRVDLGPPKFFEAERTGNS